MSRTALRFRPFVVESGVIPRDACVERALGVLADVLIGVVRSVGPAGVLTDLARTVPSAV